MHKSQLAGFIIDCKTDNIDAAAKFWSQALGLKPDPADAPATAKYVYLDTNDPNGLNIEVQQVDHESRVHLDIETDDIEAEVQRLEKLGAKRVKQYERWWVLEAPTGQRFCVVRARRANFDKEANVWE
jgi:predicted enzyme related to lactoylglutathione lyase